MNPTEGLLLAGLAGLGVFWWDGLQKRELALQAARRVCEQAGVQFLDDTVALRKMALRRDPDMRARVYREYSFEYSSVGDDRQAGRVYLLGNKLLSADLLS
ncbi:MAG: hypothetical protein FD187_1381 [bacterium]|nr:MAG: hypothetical protein FD142_1575 [bacterium]KAF0149242.1 MAG: hypothetical protein FD187_1381 [bacterium]KAF0168879.1 MAG: hypothetical protein FD158_1001 [bacterium]TXT20059.1 MAG: hypothetical protein FD132_1487 [bacterium]